MIKRMRGASSPREPVRVVTLHAVYVAFNEGMVLRKMELGLHFEAALETRRRIFPGIDDELAPPATRGDVQAARAVAGFAPGLAGHGGAFEMKPGVRTRGKSPDDVGMAFETGLIAHVSRPGNFGRREHSPGKAGT